MRLTEYDVEVLRWCAGGPQPLPGAATNVCYEDLCNAGYIKMSTGKLTQKGEDALKLLEHFG